jgi:GDPmannose 4,6-dehydratase
MKRALICGIGGQDGSYLARFLLNRGYQVFGTSRDVLNNNFLGLNIFGIFTDVSLSSMVPTDLRSVLEVLEWSNPDEIYALSGQSSVGRSFDMPAETLESIVQGTLVLLEAVRMSRKRPRIFHASSSECFGDLDGRPATEQTAFRPCSPYGVAKASAHFLVSSYRKSYGLFAANGIMFNHESPLRPERFVTRKICAAVARIAVGSQDKLRLGNLDIVRDWGWAPDYVEAMWRVLQMEAPDDFIVATGRSNSLKDFTCAAFEAVGLDWRDHVEIDRTLSRPADLHWSGALPDRSSHLLQWSASVQMQEVAQLMVEADLVSLTKEPAPSYSKPNRQGILRNK